MGSKLNDRAFAPPPVPRDGSGQGSDRLYVRAFAHASRMLPRLRGNQVHDPADAFAFIVRFKRDHDGMAPTTRELMAAVRIPSTSVAQYVLRQLEQAGLIRIAHDGKNRAIRVPGGDWKWQAQDSPRP